MSKISRINQLSKSVQSVSSTDAAATLQDKIDQFDFNPMQQAQLIACAKKAPRAIDALLNLEIYSNQTDRRILERQTSVADFLGMISRSLFADDFKTMYTVLPVVGEGYNPAKYIVEDAGVDVLSQLNDKGQQLAEYIRDLEKNNDAENNHGQLDSTLQDIIALNQEYFEYIAAGQAIIDLRDFRTDKSFIDEPYAHAAETYPALQAPTETYRQAMLEIDAQLESYQNGDTTAFDAIKFRELFEAVQTKRQLMLNVGKDVEAQVSRDVLKAFVDNASAQYPYYESLFRGFLEADLNRFLERYRECFVEYDLSGSHAKVLYSYRRLDQKIELLHDPDKLSHVCDKIIKEIGVDQLGAENLPLQTLPMIPHFLSYFPFHASNKTEQLHKFSALGEQIVDEWNELVPELLLATTVLVSLLPPEEQPPLQNTAQQLSSFSTFEQDAIAPFFALLSALKATFEQQNNDLDGKAEHLFSAIEERLQYGGSPVLRGTAFFEKGIDGKHGTIEPQAIPLDAVTPHISGQFVIIPDAKRQCWHLGALNSGMQKISFTQNYFTNKQTAQISTAHDDTSYGHGVLLNEPGAVGWVQFKNNDKYNEHTIEEGGYVRLGIRGHAMGIFKLPPLDGEPVFASMQDLDWYSETKKGELSEAHQTAINDVILQTFEANLNQERHLYGRCQITPARNGDGQILGWDVRFDNHGHEGFTGTIAFSNSNGKNDGYGLESMPLPDYEAGATQRIHAHERYGVAPKPGEKLRVAIRGLGSTEIELPEDKPLNLMLPFDLTLTGEVANKSYFDKDELAEKRGEKLGRVRFLNKGEDISHEIQPNVYTGETALARSTFNAPELQVSIQRKNTKAQLELNITSKLPPHDEFGDLELKVCVEGLNHNIPVTLLSKSVNTQQELSVEFEPDSYERVRIRFPGTGWFQELTAEQIKNGDIPNEWLFREDFGFRADLRPELS